VKVFHGRLAELGLRAIGASGFALAGGYAVSENGMGDRLSNDVDLFTDVMDTEAFSDSVDTLVAAFEAADMAVEVVRRGPLFLDAVVCDALTGDRGSIQLGYDYRQFPPVRLDVGPVLDPRDAVANKLIAMCGRYEARDYLDVYAAVESGLFSFPETVALADQHEANALDRTLLAWALAQFPRIGDVNLALYGVDAGYAAEMAAVFDTWADDVRSGRVDTAIARRQ